MISLCGVGWGGKGLASSCSPAGDSPRQNGNSAANQCCLTLCLVFASCGSDDEFKIIRTVGRNGGFQSGRRGILVFAIKRSSRLAGLLAAAAGRDDRHTMLPFDGAVAITKGGKHKCAIILDNAAGAGLDLARL